MFTVRVWALIDLPLQLVFEYVADFRHAPRWQAQLESVRLDDGPFPVGRHVVENHRLLGLRIGAHGDLVAWQPLQGFTVRGRSGLLQVESRYSFAAEPPGTRVTLNLTMVTRGPARLVEPMFRRRLRNDLEAAFRQLPITIAADRDTGRQEDIRRTNPGVDG
jgi:uncharacterized membrane protein